MKTLRRHTFHLIAAMCAAFCLMAAFRGFVAARELDRQSIASQSDFAPFAVESAIMYKLARDFADGRAIGGTDARFQGIERPLAEQMSLGLEYYLGTMLKLRRALLPADASLSAYEDHPAETIFMRRMMLLPVGLLGAFMLLLLWELTRHAGFTALGTLFYIAAPAAVARYTGQDLLKGEFALCWILAAFACLEASFRGRRKWPIAGGVLAAFAAAAFWDASQIIFGTAALWEIGRKFFTSRREPRRAHGWIAIYAGIVLAAATVPYLRSHATLLSPVVLWLFPAAIAANFFGVSRRAKWAYAGVAAGLGALWFAVTAGGVFASKYSHFAELVAAKIRFGNVKPLNPGLLTFDQRFLWTPSLDSATWRTVRMFFPAGIWAGFALCGWGLCVPGFRRRFGRVGMYVFLAAGYLVGHVYFSRYHVFAALFAAPLVAGAGALLYRALRERHRFAARLVLFAVAAAAAYEIQSGCRARRFYPADMPYKAELVRMMRAAKWRNRVVLGDLDVSSLAFGYAGTRIVVQPKFELPEVRKQVREYIEGLFADEPAFARYCAAHDVDFVVFARGTALAEPHILNLRYMAAARTLRPDMAAYKMDVSPEKLRHFALLETPAEFARAGEYFRIFRYISPVARRRAARLCRQAEAARRNGEMGRFKKLLTEAALLDPLSETVYGMYFAAFHIEIPPPVPGDYGAASPL